MKIAVMWVVLGLLLTTFDGKNLVFQAFLASGIFMIALMWKRLQYTSSPKINHHGE